MKNALILPLFLLPLFLLLPLLAYAQDTADASAVCVISSCGSLTGYADTTLVEECQVFKYVTEALDLYGRPITIFYQVTPDSCLVNWRGHKFYQSGNTKMNRRESMNAYNLILHNLFQDE